MKLFWILNVTFYGLNNGFTFMNKALYSLNLYSGFGRRCAARASKQERDMPRIEVKYHTRSQHSDYGTSITRLSLVVLTKDDFPLNDNDDDNDNDNEKLSHNVTTDEETQEFIFKKRKSSVYDGCDQRYPLIKSDQDSLLYFYQKFYEVYQKHELLKKIQSKSITDHEKLKIIEECDYLLNMKPKHNPLYKGFEEFF